MLPYWHESIKAWAQGSRLAIVWDELHKGKAWSRKEKYRPNPNSDVVKYRWADNRAAAAARISLRIVTGKHLSRNNHALCI